MAVQAGSNSTARIMFAGRSSSLSAQIVADVREALFAKRLKPGDFLGTEKDLAARFGTSRIVARDAMRTLEALGIVEIRMGKGGGARIAQGNPRLFAEALAVQLDLTGVTAAEIMDAQRAIETLGAELAAENATPTTSRNCAGCCARRKRRSATSTSSPGCRAISIWPSPRPRTTACSWCSSSRSSTYRGRAATSPPRPSWRGTFSTSTPTRRPDRTARSERRARADGRPRQDDPRPARRRTRQTRGPTVTSIFADRKGETSWQNSSSNRTSACRNGWRRKKAISARKASTTNSASWCARPTARSMTKAPRSAPSSRSRKAAKRT